MKLNIKQQLLDYLSLNNNVVFAYLFGSYANDTYDKNSDIDIALYLKENTLDVKLQINYEISKLLKKDIDIVILNDIKNIYLLENILNGIVLKDDLQRIDFELIKEHQILDFKEFRKVFDVA